MGQERSRVSPLLHQCKLELQDPTAGVRQGAESRLYLWSGMS